jgi:hypothetical protein
MMKEVGGQFVDHAPTDSGPNLIKPKIEHGPECKQC